MKRCRTCGTEKDDKEFYKNPKSSDGLLYRCIECVKEKRKINNTVVMRRWRAKNHQQWLDYQRNYYQQNKDVINEKRREYSRKRKEILKAQRLAFKNRDPERFRKLRAGQQRRQLSTPKGKLTRAVRQRIVRALMCGKEGRSWRELVGYDLPTLMRHLEKQFKPGMTWENYGTGKGKWSIDHKIPVSAFNFEKYSDIDFGRCWALKNLRPMWSIDNSAKNNRLSTPHQPSLPIEDVL